MSSSLCIRLLKLSRDRAIHRKQSQTSETMPIWLALFAVLFACIAVKYYKWKRNPLTLMYNKIPGPDGYPFVGNLPMIPKIAGGIAIDLNNYKLHYAYLFKNFTAERPPYLCYQLPKQYGTMYRMWFWQRPMIFTTSPKVLEVYWTTYI